MLNSSLSGLLQDLIGRDHCRQAVLVTRVGSLVAQAGDTGPALELNLGPIIAMVFGTGRQMGMFLGLGQTEWHLQRGRRADLFLFPMPGDMVLVATFPSGVEEERALHVAQQMENSLRALAPNVAEPRRAPLSPELREEAYAMFDQLFAA
jgi:predicted regulator of Ras-like GTPase activity (Roadblock/LC7/MglB family)